MIMSLIKTDRERAKLDIEIPKQEGIAERIVSRLLSIQCKASEFLEAKFEALPGNTKRFLVVAFCLIGSSCSVFLIFKSFSNRAPKPISITALKVISQAELKGRQPLHLGHEMAKEGFEKVRQFRMYLDTLAKSEQGKKRVDSILIQRSGLIDSLTILENMYRLQLLNK